MRCGLPDTRAHVTRHAAGASPSSVVTPLMAGVQPAPPRHALKRHAHTDAEATGAGAAAATAPGRRNRVPVLCDINLPAPRWTHSLRADTSQMLSAPAAVALEIGTARAMSKLRARLDALARASGMQRPVRPLTFERWRWAAKFGEDGAAARPSGHPVLPGAGSKKRSPPNKACAPGGALGPAADRPGAPAPAAGAGAATGGKDATDALAEDLRMQGLMLSDGYSVARALAQESAALAARGDKERLAAGSGKPVPAPPIEVEVHRHSIDLKCGHHFVKVGHAAYAKLAILHRRTMAAEAAPEPPVATAAAPDADPAGAAPLGDSSLSYAQVDAEVADVRGGGARAELHQRMFALLLRYKSLRGHGFHAALGPAVWRTLRSRLGVGFEGFASPLNCTLPNYCSGFVDVDGAFGTAGSFFDLQPKQTLGGSFALNPPFVHAVLDAAAERAEQLLDAAQALGPQHALSIAFIMPGWKETGAHARLSGSPHLRRTVTIAAADHGFCDGASHQRQDPFRASPYDTVVFVLQTERAARRWPAHDAFEAELRAAMAATVPLASAAERQDKKKRKRPPATGEEAGAPKSATRAAGGAAKRARPSGDAPAALNSPADLARFKDEIDAWVTAKRSKDFVTADRLRAELREGGVDVEKARPKGGSGGGAKKSRAQKAGAGAEAVPPKKRKHERPKKKGRAEGE